MTQRAGQGVTSVLRQDLRVLRAGRHVADRLEDALQITDRHPFAKQRLEHALKLAGLPALTLAACLAFGAQGLPLAVAVMFASLPNSPTSYSMTRQLGGDHRMMAALITVQTLAAMATMPAVLLLMGRFAGLG